MLPSPSFVLTVPMRVNAAVLAVLLALFVMRVVGQILAATSAPRWLPSMARWYSGIMPYRHLLPTQVAFIALMVAITVAVATESSPLGGRSPDAGAWVIWTSYVYALAMAARAVRYVLATPERRGVLIPIIFHFVLAAFLFVWGSVLARH